MYSKEDHSKDNLNEEEVQQGGLKAKPLRGLTFRAVAISCAWVIFIGWLNIQSEILKVLTPISYQHAPSTPGLFIILVAHLFNLILSRVSKESLRLSKQEITMIYVMTMVGTILISSGMMYLVPSAMMHINIPLSGAGNYPLDRWEPYVDSFTQMGTPMNEESATAYWVGLNRSNLKGIPWNEWISMAPKWFIYLGSIYFMLMCLSVLIRHRWTEVEHLTFPLSEPVITMVELKLRLPGGKSVSIFENKLLWLGVFLGGFIPLWNWVAGLTPAIPSISTFYPIEQLFRGARPPWNALSRSVWPQVVPGAELMPLLVGALYFAPTGVLNSIVFSATILYVPIKLMAYNLGIINERGVYMYAYQFSIGGYIAVTISSFWLLRNELARMWREAFRENKENNHEIFSYKTAFLGLIISALIFMGFTMYYFQQPIYASLFMLILVIACSVGFGRARAMVGHPTYAECFAHTTMRDGLGGTPGLGMKGMFGASYYRMFDRGAHFMPVGWALESCKLADYVNMKRRDVGAGMLIIFAVAFFAGLLMILPPTYEFGAASLPFWPGLFWNGYAYDSFSYPYVPVIYQGRTFGTLISAMIGMVFTLFFAIMQTRYVWWPLDPLGFAIGHSPLWIKGVWVNALLVLVIKGLALRWGGQSLYTKLKPVFLGIMLGSVLVEVMTNIISLVISAFA